MCAPEAISEADRQPGVRQAEVGQDGGADLLGFVGAAGTLGASSGDSPPRRPAGDQLEVLIGRNIVLANTGCRDYHGGSAAQ